MFVLDTLILLAGVLLLLGIASSKFSARLGVPMLVLFLALGILADSRRLGFCGSRSCGLYGPGAERASDDGRHGDQRGVGRHR